MNSWREQFTMSVYKPTANLSNILLQQGITATSVIKYIRGSETLPPPLSQEEEERYIQLLADGVLEAKQILIERNLRFVVYIAKRFEKYNIDIEDIISVGTIGLVKAINTYDPNKNARLATYASRCIENEILMFLRKHNRGIAISYEELLNNSEDDERLLSDIFGTEKDTIERAIENEIDRQLLYKTIEKLTVRERNVIIMRFGLDGFEEHTQQEVAEKMGISQSYISRLEKNIFSRLRQEIALQV